MSPTNSTTGPLLIVTAASVWEISIKQALGKLNIDGDLDAVLAEDFEPIPITFDDARRAGSLPGHHRDPFDRMLVAQAQARDLVLVSRDPVLQPYDVPILVA